VDCPVGYELTAEVVGGMGLAAPPLAGAANATWLTRYTGAGVWDATGPLSLYIG
jgi:hypothetical protein